MPVRLGLLAAESEVRLGRPQDAINRCRSILEDDPSAHTAKLHMARVMAATEQFQESLQAYTELQEDMPESQIIKVELVKAHMANDNKAAALKIAEDFAASRADDFRIQAWYADILASNENFEEAGKILGRVTNGAFDPNPVPVRATCTDSARVSCSPPTVSTTTSTC